MRPITTLLNPAKHYRFWRSVIWDVRYLKRTYAQPSAILKYLAARFNNALHAKPYLQIQSDFRDLKSSLRLSDDWFTENIPYWLSVIDEYHLADRRAIKILEIGSWEGLSSFFILNLLPNATLTCVDTWQGSDEQDESDASTREVLNNVEPAFDSNLSLFEERLIKFKGTSFSYFNDHPQRNVFDMIYVDGSHHSDDVVVDAIKSFEMLKVGGLLIFDDYFWNHYARATDNPAAAINVFLRLKKGSFKIVRVYYQIIIEKTADRYLERSA